ncbi:MAG: histidine-type phosphatase [Prevotella sp.]|nr:histidine-type phosphatase [Prevotella sp.]
MKKSIIALTVLLGVSAPRVMAQNTDGVDARQQIKENIYRSASNYYAYPGPQQKKLTPAPKGYEPYYISHYGRHGSRYLISRDDYDKAWKVLLRADSMDKLTDYGKDVLRRVVMIRNEADHRRGELTLLGAEQHRGIAHRMYEHFPQVFKGKTNIDAKSTIVIRCILSMENALQELKCINPQLIIRHDASEHDMWYMNNERQPQLFRKRWNDDLRGIMSQYRKRHANYDRLMQRLFNDTAYVNHEVNAENLNYHLFKLASNLQSSELRHSISLYDLFNEQEVYDNWMIENANWYVTHGPCPLNGGLQPFSQRFLLGVILHEADSCLALPHPGATLRFGHETCVMPLTCLLELNNFGKQITDFERLPEIGWVNYHVFPMGANIQFIFYKPKKGKGDILVKVLLNENEARLPLTPVSGPYYRWTDFRDYYTKKLASFKEENL